MTVTRDVISDLWPLYTAREASADTVTLVEAFLATDPEFAATLRAAEQAAVPEVAVPALPPDHELASLQRTRRRLFGYARLLQLALIFSGLAFGRIVSDTSWDVSPRNFIILASMAAAFWIAFFVTLWRMRSSITIVSTRGLTSR